MRSLKRRAEAVAPDVAEEVAHRTLPEVVVVRLLLELREDSLGVLVGPVRQHHDVLAVVLERLGLARLDHQRTVDAQLLLKRGVAVVPVRAALPHRKAVGVALARMDSVEAEARHAVHVGGQQDAVPVNGRLFVQGVGHSQRHRVALSPSQQRAWQRSVDRQGRSGAAGDVGGRGPDPQIELGPAQYGLAGGGHWLGRRGRAAEHPHAGGDPGDRQSFDKLTSLHRHLPELLARRGRADCQPSGVADGRLSRPLRIAA